MATQFHTVVDNVEGALHLMDHHGNDTVAPFDDEVDVPSVADALAAQHHAVAERDAGIAASRAEMPCDESERSAWAGSAGVYMRAVFEFLKTEETYVQILLLIRHLYYEPLANGIRGAPKLSQTELESIFSTLITGISAAELTTSGTNAEMDILTLHVEHFFQALRTHAADEVPSPGGAFQHIVGQTRVLDLMTMVRRAIISVLRYLSTRELTLVILIFAAISVCPVRGQLQTVN
jgi:hypothetical protein